MCNKNATCMDGTYHIWGDEWPFWNDLYQAESMIMDYVYGQNPDITFMMKEKYGTLRYQHYYRTGEDTSEDWETQATKEMKDICFAVSKAVQMFPHIEYEITEDCPYPELLKDLFIYPPEEI